MSSSILSAIWSAVIADNLDFLEFFVNVFVEQVLPFVWQCLWIKQRLQCLKYIANHATDDCKDIAGNHSTVVNFWTLIMSFYCHRFTDNVVINVLDQQKKLNKKKKKILQNVWKPFQCCFCISNINHRSLWWSTRYDECVCLTSLELFLRLCEIVASARKNRGMSDRPNTEWWWWWLLRPFSFYGWTWFCIEIMMFWAVWQVALSWDTSQKKPTRYNEKISCMQIYVTHVCV